MARNWSCSGKAALGRYRSSPQPSPDHGTAEHRVLCMRDAPGITRRDRADVVRQGEGRQQVAAGLGDDVGNLFSASNSRAVTFSRTSPRGHGSEKSRSRSRSSAGRGASPVTGCHLRSAGRPGLNGRSWHLRLATSELISDPINRGITPDPFDRGSIPELVFTALAKQAPPTRWEYLARSSA